MSVNMNTDRVSELFEPRSSDLKATLLGWEGFGEGNARGLISKITSLQSAYLKASFLYVQLPLSGMLHSNYTLDNYENLR